MQTKVNKSINTKQIKNTNRKIYYIKSITKYAHSIGITFLKSNAVDYLNSNKRKNVVKLLVSLLSP